MIYYIYTLFDNCSGQFSSELTLFPNHDLAYASLRRSTRDAYRKGAISIDWLEDFDYACIGEFDSSVGCIDHYGTEEKPYIHVDAYEMVSDIGDGEDADS